MLTPKQFLAEAADPTSHAMRILRNEYHGSDSASRTKDGHIVLRKGFFYGGSDTEGHVKKVSSKLHALGIKHTVVDSGSVWKPFRGGSSLKNSSHYHVKIKVDSVETPKKQD